MSPWPGAFAVVLVLIILAAIIGTVAQHLRARRNERQLQDHIRMRHGMRYAARMGWLPDDMQ